MKNLIRHGWMTALLVLLYCLPAMGYEQNGEGNSTFGIEVYETTLPDQTNWHYLTVTVSGQDSGPLKGVMINIPFAGEDLGITGSGGQYATGDDGTIRMLLYGNGCTYQFQIGHSGYEPYSSGQFTMDEDREIRVLLNRIISNGGNHTGGGSGGGSSNNDSGGNEYDSTEAAKKPDEPTEAPKQEETEAQKEPDPQAPAEQPAAPAAGDPAAPGQGGDSGRGGDSGNDDNSDIGEKMKLTEIPNISEFKITPVPGYGGNWRKPGGGGAAGNGGSGGGAAGGNTAMTGDEAGASELSDNTPGNRQAGPGGVTAGSIPGVPGITLVRSRETPVILSGMMFTLLLGLGRIGYMEYIRRHLYRKSYLEEFFDE